MEWKKLRESSFLPVDKLAISAISKELQYKWARLKMQIYVIGLMALIGLFCRLMLVHLHQFYSFVHCVAGKNLYNNEHVAVKLVSFLFTFSATQLIVELFKCYLSLWFFVFWSNLGVNFHPVHGSEPNHFWGMVVLGPNIGEPDQVLARWINQ